MTTPDEATLAKYLSRHYPVRLDYSGDDRCWFVRYPDLPGCLADGETEQEAIQNGEEAKALWIEAALEHGQSVPEPSVEDTEYSGRILLRVPKDMHRRLTHLAEQQGTSMNQFIVRCLERITSLTEFARLAESMLAASPLRVFLSSHRGIFPATTDMTLRPQGAVFWTRSSHVHEEQSFAPMGIDQRSPTIYEDLIAQIRQSVPL